MKRSAFTLIELLIVIAIIAIIAGILFPVFATAREKARQTACLSNLKQIGLAVIQYEQDFDECGPDGNGTRNNCSMGWAGQIYPFVKSTAVFICPSDTSAGVPISSYGYNMNFSYQSSYFGPSVTYPISRFVAPSKTVMLFELQNYSTGMAWTPYHPVTVLPGEWGSPIGNGCGGAYNPMPIWNNPSVEYATGYPKDMSSCWYGDTYGYATYTGPLGRHNGGACYLMADGHAKWFMGTQVSAGSNNGTSGDCTGVAANTGCATIAATYSLY
ncbi:MAG: DUF1559 domain-containing protein [Capsulimonadaceae bacterium]|nr:DUF1559 domain-containing protein [Capsulimonadaceae bacterium]